MTTTSPAARPHPADAVPSHTVSPFVDRVLADLTDPEVVHRRLRAPQWWAQSLAVGALGAALLHVHRARTGRAGWNTAHAWLTHATARPVDDGPGSHLHYGAPALAYVLHHAAADQPGRFARALDVLDARTARLTGARVDAAHRRIDRGDTPALGEFDAIRGLTGLGALWLRRDPDGPHLRGILEYLVRLTDPLPGPDGPPRPGWWTHLAPNGRRTAEFPDGHANNGLSHGIAGPLALLAVAARAGYRVHGQHAALRRILAWYDIHQHTDQAPTEHGREASVTGRIWWPYWTTDPNHDPAPGSGPASRESGAGRPSWCYGTPGIARAQHLAGLALADPHRIRTAETALLAAIIAPDLAARLNHAGLCHGLAGALLVTRRAATDSTDPRLYDAAHHLQQLASDHAAQLLALPTTDAGSPLTEPGLFDGAAGVALALDDPATPDGQEWDACLLTT